MQYFDLHCDTLYKATVNNTSIKRCDGHISVDKADMFSEWHQMFAIWIPDEIRGAAATSLFSKASQLFCKETEDNSCLKMHFCVENASMLNGDMRNFELLTDNHVRYVTLTWNGENELGGGALCSGESGLTTFGANVVREMQHHNISVDLSHSSDALFYDVIRIAKKPVIATHSNSRTVTNVKRNLTDDQFKIIRDMGGIVGLNFYKGFLNDDPERATVDDILRHADHFLNLAGENTLAIGADFDGADMPADILGVQTIPYIYDAFVRNFGANLTKKVFFDNANLYFTNFDNI